MLERLFSQKKRITQVQRVSIFGQVRVESCIFLANNDAVNATQYMSDAVTPEVGEMLNAD